MANKRPDVTYLLKKKSDYDTKISAMEKNVLLLLIILKFIKEYTWCKDNRKKLVNESGLDKKKKTLAAKEEIKKK